MVTATLVEAIVNQHKLNGSKSIHFIDHWARVMENGRRLASLTGARLDVVEFFAVFHDAGRQSDGHDHQHGQRGAEVALRMRGKYFDLDQKGFDLLVFACQEHTHGEILGDVTVQTCWDADRLDLGRAGYTPSPEKLCTSAARAAKMIAWAHERSLRRDYPDLIQAEWGLKYDSAGNFYKK